MTSTEAGRNVITEASESLKDDLLNGLRDADITNIKYHVNTCYADYRKKKERLELKRSNDTLNSTTFFANTGTLNRTCGRAKRAKTAGHQIPRVENCIICNQNHVEEIVENYAFVKQGDQSSSFLQSTLIKTRF